MTQVQETIIAPVPSARNQARAILFSAEKSRLKRVPITLNGVELELQQPTVDDVVRLHSRAEGQSSIAIVLINHAYLPGTKERVFEDTDYDTLAALPYSSELTVIQEKMNSFIVGDEKAVEKN